MKRKKLKDRWQMYVDAECRWRWHVIASNGRVVDASTQSYSRRYSAWLNAKRNGAPALLRTQGEAYGLPPVLATR